MPNSPAALQRAKLPPLVLLHLTTSGPSLHKDRILEVSLGRVNEGRLQEHWYRLICPEHLSASTRLQLSLHPEDLRKGIQLPCLQQQLDAFCQEGLLVGYGLREQLAFLKSAGLVVRPKQQLCLQKAAQHLESNSPLQQMGLLELANTLELQVLRPWRAPDRMLLLWQLLVRWEASLALRLAQLVKEQFQQRILPLHLDPEILNQLPDTPGVYRMFASPGQEGEAPLPLYIGKSIHLRSRVKSHFSADQRTTKALRMAQEIRSLDWITAAGDLGAQLKEAQQIKTLQPRMNRRLRRQKKLLSWQQAQPQQPLQLTQFNLFNDSPSGLCLGLFTSSRQAKKQLSERAEAYKLCLAVLGIEKKPPGQACFAYQLGRCLGACCGLEELSSHQQRLEEAFQDLQFQQWPWSGACLLEEKGAGGCEYHALHTWQYLGSADEPEAAWQLTQQPLDYFDRDTYRLLKKVLLPLRSNFSWQGSQLRILERH